ncbi:MAG: hypothetical protein ABI045_02055 [Flavobacteriales bacterium]
MEYHVWVEAPKNIMDVSDQKIYRRFGKGIHQLFSSLFLDFQLLEKSTRYDQSTPKKQTLVDKVEFFLSIPIRVVRRGLKKCFKRIAFGK